MRRFSYSGDKDAAYGGYLYCLDTFKDDYVDVVRITPCSDAGGPDNCWWIECLVVLIPEKGSKREHDALNACGWIDDDAYAKAKGATKQRMMLDAALSYGFYDPSFSTTWPSTEMVQVGKAQSAHNKHEGEFKPTVILRGNSNIINYARKRAKEL